MNTKIIVTVVLLILCGSLIVNVKAADEVNEIDTYFENVRGQLFGFYGSEIVSHAGIILGLVVSFPSIMLKLWVGRKSKRLPLFVRDLTVFFLIGALLILLAYVSGRLVYWSALGAALTGATRPAMVEKGFNVTSENITSCTGSLSNYALLRFEEDPSPLSVIALWLHPKNGWNLVILLTADALLSFSGAGVLYLCKKYRHPVIQTLC